MSDHFGNIPIHKPESSSTDIPQNLPPPRVRGGLKKKKRPPASPLKSAVLGLFSLLVITLSSYCVLGFWGVPYYLTNFFPQQFLDKTDMVLQPSTVSFNPFTFRFETGELAVISKDNTVPMLSFNSLSTQIALLPLLQRQAVCRSITLKQLSLNITREKDGSYDFQQLLNKIGKNQGSTISELTELPFSYSLNNISIADASIKLEDIPTGKIHTVEKIQLDLPNLANIPLKIDQFLRPHFSAIVNGSPIELSGQTPNELDNKLKGVTKLSLNLHQLDLTLYADYLPLNLPIEFQKGIADGKIDLLFDPQKTTQDKFTLGFQLAISDAKLKQTEKPLSFVLPATLIKGTFLPTSKKIELEELSIKNPSLNYIGQSLFADIWSKKTTTDKPETAKSSYKLSINRLLIDKGSVAFFAKEDDQNATSSWENLQLAIKGYHHDLETEKEFRGGSFSISGEQKDSPCHFSWQGEITGLNIFTGDFILQKMESSKALNFFHKDLPFSVSGLTDIHGQLTLSPPEKGTNGLTLKLVQADASIDTFLLLDKKSNSPIIHAQRAKISSITFEDNRLQLGKIDLEKSQAHFSYGQIPEVFSSFDPKYFGLKELNYQGSVHFSHIKNSALSLNFTELNLTASNLDFSNKNSNNLTITGKTDNGTKVKAQGTVSLKPFTTVIQTEFSKMMIQELLPFFVKTNNLDGVSGYVTGNGTFTLPAKKFSGTLQLSNVTDRSLRNNLLTLGTCVFHEFDYVQNPFTFKSKKVQIDRAKLHWQIDQKGKEPTQYLSGLLNKYLDTDVQNSNSKKSATSKGGLKLQQISFANSTVDISDKRAVPTWQSKVTDFSGKFNGIDSSVVDQNSDFSLSGNLDGIPFTVGGQTKPFSKSDQGTFRFSLDKYPLASFYKQQSTETDIDLSKGDAQLLLDCNWLDNNFISEGMVTLSDLSPSDPTSKLSLPLALMTDQQGNLQQSFEFTRTNPVGQTSLINQLFSTFQTNLLKGSVSPLLLAKGDFTDLIDNEIIAFRPGEFMLSGEGRKTLSRYTALLSNHPNIGLVLSGGVTPKTDSQAMEAHLRTLEQKRVEMLNEKLFKEWQDKKAGYEEELLNQQKTLGPDGKIVEHDIPLEILTGFSPIKPETIVVDQEMLAELAQNRIDIIYKHFTTQLPQESERVSISEQTSSVEKSAASTSGVSINLKAINR